jgi:hypothetical protein
MANLLSQSHHFRITGCRQGFWHSSLAAFSGDPFRTWVDDALVSAAWRTPSIFIETSRVVVDCFSVARAMEEVAFWLNRLSLGGN